MKKLTTDLLDNAIQEAKRFIQKAEAAKERLKQPDQQRWTVNTKETGAVKRAALDLKSELTNISQSIRY